MNVYPVDPRDQTSEVSAPAYRVIFWTGGANGCASDEYECVGADVFSVIQWANDNSAGRAYSLWVRIPDRDTAQGDGVCLVRLAGWDADSSSRQNRPPYAVSVPADATTGVV